MTAIMTLFADRRRVLRIVRDKTYPTMWRVELPDGTLTDMCNLARAKDAALDIAEGIEARKTPHKSPLQSLRNFSWSRPPAARSKNLDLPPVATTKTERAAAEALAEGFGRR
jgi:hypothetical protein